MKLSMIVACDRNWIIGKGNELPWHIPDELAYFKRMTLGKPVIMGRKTFESLPNGPLPGRPNLVISRQMRPGVALHENHTTYHVLPEFDADLLRRRVSLWDNPRVNEAIIIGGLNLYEQAYPLVDRIYLTAIAAKYEGDVRLPWTTAQLDRDFAVEREIVDTREGRPTLMFYTLERRL